MALFKSSCREPIQLPANYRVAPGCLLRRCQKNSGISLNKDSRVIPLRSEIAEKLCKFLVLKLLFCCVVMLCTLSMSVYAIRQGGYTPSLPYTRKPEYREREKMYCLYLCAAALYAAVVLFAYCSQKALVCNVLLWSYTVMTGCPKAPVSPRRSDTPIL